MKELKIKRSFCKASCIMELGKPYRIYSQFARKPYVKDGILIRTGTKGFNILSLKKHKCVFKRNVYQKNSAKKTIGREQTVFEINLPYWIDKIEALDPLTVTKYIDTEEEVVEKTQITCMKNALYRMEL
jgi:hypothetical protein